nr:ankyrin repeat, PH and SEC7 domain containing protein secG-like [Onthophagus taurus]
MDELNVLFKGIREDDVNIIKKYLKIDHNKVNLVDQFGCSCVHIAAKYESLESLKYLLTLKETEINIKNKLGETPLLYALKHNDSVEIIVTLINNKCDVTLSDNNQNTALHLAASKNIKIGRLLIEKGVDINMEGLYKSTPLHCAVLAGNVEFGRLLIENGANIDAKDIDGKTALHKAVWQQNVEFVKMLLYYNASVNITDKFKNKPFNIAVSVNNNEIATILIDYIEVFGDAKESMKLLVSAISKNMHIAFNIANKIQIGNIENEDLIIFKPIYSCFMRTNDSLKWVRILLSKQIPIKLFDIQCFYDFKGFCVEIELILASDVYVIFDNYCGEFVQRLVFNCYINQNESDQNEKNKLKHYFVERKCVPSLMQIARDYCRKIIFDNQRKNNFKPHHIIMEMDVPKIVKDVLLLKRPIYLFCK